MTDYYPNRPATGFQDRRDQTLNRREQTIIRREQAVVRKEHELNDLSQKARRNLTYELIASTSNILFDRVRYFLPHQLRVYPFPGMGIFFHVGQVADRLPDII